MVKMVGMVWNGKDGWDGFAGGWFGMVKMIGMVKMVGMIWHG